VEAIARSGVQAGAGGEATGHGGFGEATERRRDAAVQGGSSGGSAGGRGGRHVRVADPRLGALDLRPGQRRRRRSRP
jgi:hypothetical protein